MSRRATSRPVPPGSTTSVRRRSMRPPWADTTSTASSAHPATRTRYPLAPRIRRKRTRSGSSSSTTRLVPHPPGPPPPVVPPAGLLHDAVAGGQPEAGAGTYRLGGEERLKRPPHGAAVHALAAVTDHDLDVRARVQSVAGRKRVRAKPDVPGLDGEAAAGRHRVARVGREVHQDLLELARVEANRPEPRREHDAQLDVGADQPGEQALRRAGQRVEVDHARPGDLPPREAQELP